jgi:ABC-type Fe3+/spermidine/putrescine transport system ATPase subunit
MQCYYFHVVNPSKIVKFAVMHLLSISGISKNIGQNDIVTNISFCQENLQKIAIVGETGSGKSTVLKIIAGLIQADTGEVIFENKSVKGPEETLVPGHPGIAYLSQDFELRANYRIEELLAYANHLTDEDAQSIFTICRIQHLLKRKPHQVSGGEKQRIALARLLIMSPRLLLLDEPFSNMDLILKNVLKKVIHDIGEKLGITIILVSHDPQDTLSWADEILVMKDGRIIQKGSPEQIYFQPQTEYIAGLFGKYNLLASENNIAGKKRFFRPENFSITDSKQAAISGIVKQISFLGSYFEVTLTIPDDILVIHATDSRLKKGDIVYLSFQSENLWHV